MTVDGVLLIDKPSGISSAGVLRRIKHSHKIQKIGHSGTLDPLATGLLVVLLGKCTKLQQFFLCADKSYSGTIILGQERDTDDIDGEIVSETSVDIKSLEQSICDLGKKYIGDIAQMPPVYSAIKVGGKKSYETAREGKTLELQPRNVAIHSLELIISGDSKLDFHVTCSSGTYVRALARDIGRDLGVGACIESLRRDSSGFLSVAHAQKLPTIEASENLADFISPIESIAEMLPHVHVDQGICNQLMLGQQGALACADLKQELDSIGSNLVVLIDPTGSPKALVENTTAVWRLQAVL